MQTFFFHRSVHCHHAPSWSYFFYQQSVAHDGQILVFRDGIAQERVNVHIRRATHLSTRCEEKEGQFQNEREMEKKKANGTPEEQAN